MKHRNVLPDSATNAPWLLCVWGVVFLLQTACTSVSAERTFETMGVDIEAPLKACPTISGTYEFVGTPLPGMPSTWRGSAKRDYSGNPAEGWQLTFDRFLRGDWGGDTVLLKNRDAVTEVEVIQSQTIQVRFKGPFGQKIVELPERPDDRLGCGKGTIILARIRGTYLSEGGGSGYNVFKHTFVKNVDGSLDVTVQLVGQYRTLLFPWTYEELNGARFAPKR